MASAEKGWTTARLQGPPQSAGGQLGGQQERSRGFRESQSWAGGRALLSSLGKSAHLPSLSCLPCGDANSTGLPESL